MAHFAKLDENNIVTAVHVVSNKEILVDGVENEQKGIDYLNTIHKLNATWKQTSYNTLKGVHRLDGTPFRKNYAGMGYIYDEVRDAFYAPRPYPSWTLNEATCHWKAPIPYPETSPDRHAKDENYSWNEETKSWVLDEWVDHNP